VFADLGLPNASLLFHIAQLRHAYSHLVSGRVKDQRQFADGLIAPAIEAFERHLSTIEDTTRINGKDKQCASQ
jgi:hypothetical protein